MTLDSSIKLISQHTSTSNNKSYIFTSTRHEIDQFLQAVDAVQSSIGCGTAYDQTRAKSVIQTAMSILAHEMHNILKMNNKSTDHNLDSSTTMTDTGSNSYVDDYQYASALNVTVIDDLRSIVNRMNIAGYLLECKEAYISNRKHCIGSSYQKLSIQKLSNEDARKMEWNELESIIKVWMRSAKICFRKIFLYEKQLCEKIFGDLGDNVDNDCFLRITNVYTNQLLDIAMNLSCVKIASERLFGILELYKTFKDLIPEMNELFNTQLFESIRTDADQIVIKLAGAASMAVEKFEKDLLIADVSQLVPVDKIHSLCKYVMDYVFRLGQNKQTLMELNLSKPPLTADVEMDFVIVDPRLQNKLPYHVMWIIMCLVSKLEDEAKVYKNAADINFYLMNRFFYIVYKINGMQEVKEMIGDEWFEKLSAKFDQAKGEYLRLTFAKVLSILGGNKPLQKRLKSFNREFKKLQINLGKLRVPDFQLLKDILASIEEMLVPSYSLFLAQLNTSPRLTLDLKFSVEQLKSAILSFFPSP
ncbi:exocyst complex component EXO70B1-like [Bidens hawaiensis]|uniref:exocyst complex component EXO70B1-like n=1 Tax=Bidens hawaiensis TaxID=980011 RepID=UPI00404A1B81